MVNLFFFFNFDHSYQNECIFSFFRELDPYLWSHITQWKEKTRTRITICGKIKGDCNRQNQIIQKLTLSKLLFQVLILLYISYCTSSYIKRNSINGRIKPLHIFTFFQKSWNSKASKNVTATISFGKAVDFICNF